MIVVKMQGRFGNQMFIYAFGLMMEHLCGKPVFYDSLSLSEGVSPWWSRLLSYILIRFGKRVYPVELSCMKVPFKKASILNMALRRFHVVHETDDLSPEDLLALLESESNLYFDGYWQDRRFFSNIEDRVRQTFAFHRKLPVAAQRLLEQIRDSTAIAVHVRRGDYVHNPRTAAAHNVCDLTYYQKAINLLREEVSNARFFIFSDDIPWCRRNLEMCGSDVVFVETSELAVLHIDLELMMNCRHFVVANSSYSWWAAYLGAAPGKFVVAPSTWNRLHTEAHPQCADWKLVPC